MDNAYQIAALDITQIATPQHVFHQSIAVQNLESTQPLNV
jgi:hypothetical protein